MSPNAAKPNAALAGIVRIQAPDDVPGDPPHFTAPGSPVVPTPMMAELMICVVLTGIPRCDIARMVPALTVSAAKPWTGRSLVIRWPTVLTIRRPRSGPSAMAACAASMTLRGTGRLPGSTPARHQPVLQRSGAMSC